MLGIILGSIFLPGLIFIIGLAFKKEKPKLAKGIIGIALGLAVILMIKTIIVPVKVLRLDGLYVIDMMSTGTGIMSRLVLIIAMIAVLANMSNHEDPSDKNDDAAKSVTSGSIDEDDDDYDDDLI